MEKKTKEQLQEVKLLELRKIANEAGIENYSKYSREQLIELILQKQDGVTTYIAEDMIESDEDAAATEKAAAEHAETVSPKAEDPDAETAKAEKKAKKEKKEKAPKEKKEKKSKEKKEKAPKVKVDIIAKEGEKPELHATASKIYDELLKNDGRSYGQIAKDLGTHYNMVRRVCETYFVQIPADQASTASQEASAEEQATQTVAEETAE